MSDNKVTMKKAAASKPSDPADSNKRKRGEGDTFNEQAARAATVMKRICIKVNKEIKKKLPEKHGPTETKETKIKWQKARREARSELKRELTIDAMLAGNLPNPMNYTTKEEALENYDKDMHPNVKLEKNERKLLAEEKAERELQEKAEAKKAKRESKKRKLEAVEVPDEAEVAIAPPSHKQERYPTSGEKKERKRAAEAGLSVEDYRLKLEVEQNQSAITAKLAKLSVDEQAQYQERAALKQQSFELYVLRRIQKKESKNTVTSKSKPPEALFFTDLDGDTNLLNAIPPPPNYARKADGSVPLDPSIWADRNVKDLTKEERNARRNWMRQKRQPEGTALAEAATASEARKLAKEKAQTRQ